MIISYVVMRFYFVVTLHEEEYVFVDRLYQYIYPILYGHKSMTKEFPYFSDYLCHK